MTSPAMEDARSIPTRATAERLAEIERVLKFDSAHPDRRQLIREYLELTEPEQKEKAA